MFLHPDLLMTQFQDRQRELIAEADRQHLIAILRRRRRSAESTRAARGHDTDVRAARAGPAGPPDGTLAGCGPRVAAPAR